MRPIGHRQADLARCEVVLLAELPINRRGEHDLPDPVVHRAGS
jgi:hypothetical protein